jgi:hypothetical protein
VPEQDATRQVLATIGQRLTTVLTQTVGEEMARASTKGVPTETVLQEALNVLLRMAAVVAGTLIAPDNAAPHDQQARSDRLHSAFTQAVHRIMEGEIGALERKGHG